MEKKRRGRKPLSLNKTNTNANIRTRKRRRRKRKEDDDDDDSDIIIDSSNIPAAANKYVSSKYKLKDKADINIVLAQDEADAFKAKAFCWNTITAGTTALICRKICTICGYEAKYRCLKCFEHKSIPIIKYYCSMKCKKKHDETNCCK